MIRYSSDMAFIVVLSVLFYYLNCLFVPPMGNTRSMEKLQKKACSHRTNCEHIYDIAFAPIRQHNQFELFISLKSCSNLQ